MKEGEFDQTRICIIRHGQAVYNIQRGYPFPDPPLTKRGYQEASSININFTPDLIVVSPMRRTIETAFTAFGTTVDANKALPIEVWPDLREAHDAICNHFSPVAVLQMEYPHLDFSECNAERTYEKHSHADAEKRAERVRRQLKEHSGQKLLLSPREDSSLISLSHIYSLTARLEFLVFRPRNTPN
jgi:broad specificity phosphatase PhoE